MDWLRKVATSFAGEKGASMKKIVVTILLAYIGFMFIIKFVPQIEGVDTDNITNDMTKWAADLGIWVLPVGGLIGLFYGVFKLFEGKGDD